MWIGDAYKPLIISSDYFTKITYDLRNIGKKFHVIMESSCISSNQDEVKSDIGDFGIGQCNEMAY